MFQRMLTWCCIVATELWKENSHPVNLHLHETIHNIHIYCMFLLSWYSVLSFELDLANLPTLQVVLASINYKGIYHYLSLAWCPSHDFTIIWSNLIFSYIFISHLVSSVRSLRCAMCPYPWSPATPGCQSHQPHQRSATARFGSWHVSFHSFRSTAKGPQTATKCR